MTATRRSTFVAAFAAVLVRPLIARAKLPGPPLRIGVVGAGSLGSAVGGNWVRAGHEVCFSSRHPDALADMARRLGDKASVGGVRDAAAFGPVLLLATPYDALPGLADDLRDILPGKVVLDATNPPLYGGDALTRQAKTDGAGTTSARLLPGTRLVRAFNSVDASVIEASARRTDGKVAVPIAGDDRAAVQLAAGLVTDAGCVPLDVGDLAASRNFQQGSPGFRANATLPELRRRLGLS